MYNASDIIWVKNVLRDHGNGLAYEDKTFEEPFLLHWPKGFKSSALTAPVGDIILLFQTPNFVNGLSNKNVYLTHLVSPIDTISRIDAQNPPNFEDCRLVRLIAKANPIAAIPNPGFLNFHKPNRGQTHPIRNLGDRRNVDLSQTQSSIWQLFSEFVDPIYNNDNLLLDPEIGEHGEIEGDTIIKEHIRFEKRLRSSRIVKLKKLIALHEGLGYVACECCCFDFRKKYGIIGSEFIECHHKNFLANGERITSVDDLALVCSNCHRMLHRKDNEGVYHSIESLKQLIDRQKNR